MDVLLVYSACLETIKKLQNSSSLPIGRHSKEEPDFCTLFCYVKKAF
jgi:hypothetical protein